MKTRQEVARFIEKQMEPSHVTPLNKGERHHYGFQELRELMDFIYEAQPTEAERLTNASPPPKW